MKYKAKLTGHEPPFRWQVFKQAQEDNNWIIAQIKGLESKQGDKGGTSFIQKLVNCEGESNTFDEAMAAARQAAWDSEWERQHMSTVYEEELFEVENSVDIGIG